MQIWTIFRGALKTRSWDVYSASTYGTAGSLHIVKINPLLFRVCGFIPRHYSVIKLQVCERDFPQHFPPFPLFPPAHQVPTEENSSSSLSCTTAPKSNRYGISNLNKILPSSKHYFVLYTFRRIKVFVATTILLPALI